MFGPEQLVTADELQKGDLIKTVITTGATVNGTVITIKKEKANRYAVLRRAGRGTGGTILLPPEAVYSIKRSTT